MRTFAIAASCVAALATVCAGDSNLTNPEVSKQILPNTFIPPQVFQHVNLVRTINLEKSYARETVNVVVENTDKQPQSEYYIPFEQDLIARIGSLEVREKSEEGETFPAEIVEIDKERYEMSAT